MTESENAPDLVVEQVPLDKLSIAPYNPRKISPEAMAKLEHSVVTFGCVDPLIVNKRTGYRVIGGHQRLLVLKKHQRPTAPCVVLDIDEDREKLLNVALNNQNMAGEYEFSKLADLLLEFDAKNLDVSLTGFDGAELEQIMNWVPPHEGDETKPVPEPPVDAVSKTGDLWELGVHRILCGDSTKAEDVARVMDGKKADCIFTSPPYAVGIDYGSYKDTIENLRPLLTKLADVWKHVLCEGGFAVTNFGDIVSGKDVARSDTPCEYPMALEYWPVFRNAGYVLWSRRVWCKPGAAVGSSRQCIGTNRAASNYEHIWTWKLPGVPPVNEQLSGDPIPSQAGWFDTTHDNHLDVGLQTHGAGMPVAVATRMIHVHSMSGKIVHEPFAGTGTTIIAAEKLGRRCYAIEIEPRYVDVCVKRFRNFSPKAEIKCSRPEAVDAIRKAMDVAK